MLEIEGKLQLLDFAKDFLIEKNGNGEYEIRMKYTNLAAIVNTAQNVIEFYVTGVYDFGSDGIEIEIEQLDKLREFVGLLKK